MTKNTPGLKIAFVLDDGLDSEDGVQAYILTIGSWLRGQGHEVHYLVGETHRTDIPNVHSLARNVRVTFNGNKLTIPLPVKKSAVKKFLADQQYDILHIQMPYSPFFGAKIVAQAPPGTAVIGTFHILPYGLLARIGTRMLGWALSQNLKRFDDYVSVSRAAKDFAGSAFGITTDVVPNAVDIKRFKPKKSVKKNAVFELLFLGRLVERKGCSYLLEALRTLLDTDPEVSFNLTVCGKGPLDQELKDKAARLSLSSRINFAGFVSQEEKAAYMQRADMAIFPSYAGESFGIVLVEAMAAGSGVVIGGNNPGYASVLYPTPEALVDVKDTESFALVIHQFMNDPALMSDVHQRQQEMVVQYDTAVVGKELARRYHKIAKISGLVNN